MNIRVVLFGISAMLMLAIGSIPTRAEVDNSAKRLASDKVYIAVVYLRRLEMPFTGALFCPLNGQSVKKCKNKNGYTFGNYGWGGPSFVVSNGKRGEPSAIITWAPYVRAGKHAFVDGAFGDRHIVPKNTTYYFDAKPGTIYVIPPRKLSIAQAIEATRSLLLARYNVDDVNRLKFVSIRAAEYSCTGKRKKRVCTLGKDINPRNIGR